MQTNHELLTDAREFLRDLLVGVAPGDAVARSWDEFFEIYDGIIRRFAVSCGVEAQELDECVQEVWVAIVGHLEHFEADISRGKFRTWLYQIVRSKATDLLRSKKRTATVSLDESTDRADRNTKPHAVNVDPLDEIWRRESLQTLLDDLKKRVTAESYALFEGRAVHGSSYEVLGNKLDLSPAAARTRYHRTLAKFRELCERYAIDSV